MADMLSFNQPAMPTNAAQVQQLPSQYQLPLDAAMMKRALAQALLSRGQQQPQGQTIVTGAGAPNVYVKPNITQNLSDLAATLVGAKALGSSMKEMGQVMQGYQQHRQEEVDSLLNGAGPSEAPQSQRYIQAGTAGMSSNDATVRAQAGEWLKVGAELHKNEQDHVSAQQIAGFTHGAGAAEGPSVIAAAQAPSGMDASRLKPPTAVPVGASTDPNNPQAPVGTGVPGQTLSPQTGLVSTTAPGTGAVSTAEGLPAKIQQRVVQAQADELLATHKDLSGMWPQMQDVAHNGAVAGAAATLLRSADPKTGAFALDRAKLMQIGQMFGYGPDVTLSPTQLLHELSLGFLGAAKTDAGFAGRLTDSDLKILRNSSGSDLELQRPVLLRIAENYKAYSDQQVRNFNSRLGEAAQRASRTGIMDPTAFSDKLIQPKNIAPVGTDVSGGIPPASAPAASVLPQNRPRRRFNPDGTPAQ